MIDIFTLTIATISSLFIGVVDRTKFTFDQRETYANRENPPRLDALSGDDK